MSISRSSCGMSRSSLSWLRSLVRSGVGTTSVSLLPSIVRIMAATISCGFFSYTADDEPRFVANWKKWHERMGEREAVRKVVDEKAKLLAGVQH